jgi:hypothetical protein
MDIADDRGAPAGEAEPKRVADKVPLRVDWHDYLINTREPGKAVAQNYVFRPPRARATGFEYKCTTAGVTSQKEFFGIPWPRTAAGAVTDGSVVWTAQAISTSSLRATVASDAWTADTGLTLSDQSNTDLIYTTYAAAGTNGERYEVKHAITLSGSPAEVKEALILLPVRN